MRLDRITVQKRVEHMTSVSDEHGNMTAVVEHFDLEREVASLQQQKPTGTGVSSKLLFKNADLRIVMLSLKAGAHLDEHHADGTCSVHVLRGAIQLRTNEQTHDLGPGHLLTLAASTPHSVNAAQDAVFLLTLSWPRDQELRALKHRGYGS
jgi:quercetin dioxygenase-like cupin family protein